MDLVSIVGLIAKILGALIGVAVIVAGIVQGIHAGLELLDRWRKERQKPTRPIPQPPRRPERRFIPRHDHEGKDLVKRVSDALGGNGLVTVWGFGGFGKTTLAIEVAHCLCPKPYSGGVIWDSADGRTDFALVTLLDKILTDLEREEARTLAPDAKADLADRLLTEAMPCLLGLDNFETIAEEEQRAIIAFLNELSCPVLVTSRESLPIGQNIRVGPMRPEEAQQFLTHLVQQSPNRDRLATVDLDRLAREAGYNPMLMRWMIRQLAHEVPAEDVYVGLDRGEGDAERVFKRSFDLLGNDGQTALLALALFGPTASREALAAVCGFEDGKDRANEAIRRLAAFDLLDTAVEGDRRGIVALTRRLTEAQLQKDERTQGLKERFVAYLLAYAEAHPEVTKEDLDALDAERENLLAALDYAYAAEDWESVMTLAGWICAPATGLLAIRGYWDEAIKWGKRAAEAASQANLPAMAAIFSGNVGTIRHWRGDYAQAREAHQKALLFFQQAGEEPSVAVALHQLGMVAQDQGDYQDAKDLYNQSLEIEKRLGNQAGIASSLHQLGSIAQDQGKYQEAKDLYNQSLEIEKQLGNQAGIASCLHQLGSIAQLQGHYQEAKDFYNRSLEIERNLGNQVGIASSLYQLGTLAAHEGNQDEAIRLFKESLAIAERLGVPEAEMVHDALARVSKEKE